MELDCCHWCDLIKFYKTPELSQKRDRKCFGTGILHLFGFDGLYLVIITLKDFRTIRRMYQIVLICATSSRLDLITCIHHILWSYMLLLTMFTKKQPHCMLMRLQYIFLCRTNKYALSSGTQCSMI